MEGAQKVLLTREDEINFNEHVVLVDTHGLYPLLVHEVAKN